MIAPLHPPKNSRGLATAEGRELRLEARPSARFNSQTQTTNCINFSQPEDESEMTCLLRPLRCLFSMSQRDHGAVRRQTPARRFGESRAQHGQEPECRCRRQDDLRRLFGGLQGATGGGPVSQTRHQGILPLSYHGAIGVLAGVGRGEHQPHHPCTMSGMGIAQRHAMQFIVPQSHRQHSPQSV